VVSGNSGGIGYTPRTALLFVAGYVSYHEKLPGTAAVEQHGHGSGRGSASVHQRARVVWSRRRSLGAGEGVLGVGDGVLGAGGDGAFGAGEGLGLGVVEPLGEGLGLGTVDSPPEGSHSYTVTTYSWSGSLGENLSL
jgi:hypothetical protein